MLVAKRSYMSLAGYLAQKKAKVAASEKGGILQKEINEIQAMQGTGLDLLVDFEFGPEGKRRPVYVSRDFSLADQTSLDRYIIPEDGKHGYTFCLNFIKKFDTDYSSVPIYCREGEGEAGKFGVLWSEFSFTDNNAGFNFNVRHNWNLAKLLQHLMNKGVNPKLIKQAESLAKELHQKYPPRSISGNSTEALLIQEEPDGRYLIIG